METTQPKADPFAGAPGHSSVEVDATQIGESAKALKLRLPDGREIWVPKSVGLMANRMKRKGLRTRAGIGADACELKTVVIVPLWFWRKVQNPQAA